MNKDSKKIIITIDGPAGSGKTTTARRVAQALGYLHLDSGALYRAVTLKALRYGIDIKDRDRAAELAAHADLRLQFEHGQLKTFLDGEDVTEAIRSPEVTAAIAPIAANPKVREILTQTQRELAKGCGVVAEGRDTGTVVFPDADLKIYMMASIEQRAKRRYEELAAKGITVDFDQLVQDIKKRDESDATRAHSPLQKPKDAIVLDTTRLSIDEQVNFVVEKAHELGA